MTLPSSATRNNMKNNNNTKAAKPATTTIEELVNSLANQVGMLTAKIHMVEFKSTWVSLTPVAKADLLIQDGQKEDGLVLGKEDPRLDVIRQWAVEARKLNIKQAAEKARTKPVWSYQVKDGITTFLRLHGRDKFMVTVTPHEEGVAIRVAKHVETTDKPVQEDLPF